MASRKYDFNEEQKVKVLLWCARHCCLCGKHCGVAIEVAHIEKGSNDIDNAIPLCFQCHAEVGHYNRSHPRGRKYKNRELRARRDQVYEQHTRGLIPALSYKLTQFNPTRRLPDVGFQIIHPGGHYPVHVRIAVTLVQGAIDYGSPPTSGHYDGRYLWNLNPGFDVSGHFSILEEVLQKREEPLRARIDVAVLDIYEREHKLLPVGYIHSLGDGEDWYLEPSEEELAVRDTSAPSTVQPSK